MEEYLVTEGFGVDARALLTDDLADSIPGLFRILDLVHEQGSSGIGMSFLMNHLFFSAYY
jgi:hypothetical protein